MPESDFLSLITSKQWRDQFAAILLGKKSEAEIEKCAPEYRSMVRWFFNKDANAGVEYYVSRGRDVPVAIGKAILEKTKPKKGGRDTSPEGWARKQAKQASCFLAMSWIGATEPGLSVEGAAKRIAKLMNLYGHDGKPAYRVVIWSWKREQKRLDALPDPPEQQ
ncbi:MAG TPA: hypothetical protein VGI46_06900 [Candidatus Acidoferrum sp.]|jgi:hypothetical protein